jgi:GT2 family glycosyltransferase
MIEVSIIIVNYNLTYEVRKLLNSIKKYVRDINFEVIVIDNNSSERDIEELVNEFPEFKFELLNTNYGFGHGNNVGVKKTTGKYLLLLNPDTYLINNLLLNLYSFAITHPEFAVIGPSLIYEDGGFQTSFAKFPNLRQEILHLFKPFNIINSLILKLKMHFTGDYFEVDFLFGSCMFIGRDVFETVNGFDEEYFLFSEETDLCYRLKKINYKMCLFKKTKLVHIKSKITGREPLKRFEQTYKSKLLFYKKNYRIVRFNLMKYGTVFLLFLRKWLDGTKRQTVDFQQRRKVYSEIIKMYSNTTKI